MSQTASHAATAQNSYKADLREIYFLLFEQFKIGDYLGKGKFADWSEDQVRDVVEGSYKFVRDVLGPLNAVGDVEGCRVEDGQVITPTGFKDAWKKTYENGWKQVGIDAEFGGMGAPHSLAIIVEEFLCGSNTAFTMYPGLAHGAGEVIEAFGTEEQRKTYCERMFNGTWGGTMCLTEPQAGSDVGAARSRAVKNADGTWSITGNKIFISAGDNDFTDNVIHLVLARVDGAPAGTKGLTLFIVPKNRFGADGKPTGGNDVTVGRIEHKMGINGSATCVLNFGESGGCVGEPVGGDAKLNQGMPQMFRLMNGARILVGVQGTAVASTAYLNALDYARDRKQGSSIKQWKDPTAPRATIIEHPDVRRMLLDMKARVEGVRALVIKLTSHQDRVSAAGPGSPEAAYHQGQVDLLVPLVKAYGSDQAFRVCETAIQTYGGAGYTKDYPVEQYCRDSKIFSIYEGTNHIQAMDLVGRKLGQEGGANMQRFLGDVGAFVARNGGHGDERIAGAVRTLGAAQEALTGAVMKLMAWAGGHDLEAVALYATRFLEMMSEVAVGWLLLDGAVIAHGRRAELAADAPDGFYYAGKIAAAVYYARTAVSLVPEKAKCMITEDRSPIEIDDRSFASTVR